MADATEQRKEEHAEFEQTNAENNAAVQLLEVAKNRMNKSRETEHGLFARSVRNREKLI